MIKITRYKKNIGVQIRGTSSSSINSIDSKIFKISHLENIKIFVLEHVFRIRILILDKDTISELGWYFRIGITIYF